LNAAFSRLTVLRSLECLYISDANFNDVPTGDTAVFFACFRELKTLQLLSCTFGTYAQLCTAMDTGTSLECIVLDKICVQYSAFLSDSATPTSTLKYLDLGTISDRTELVKWFARDNVLPSLNTLTLRAIHIDDGDVDEDQDGGLRYISGVSPCIAQFLRLLGPSLTRLTFEFVPTRYPPTFERV
jgi:hypothetical protein